MGCTRGASFSFHIYGFVTVGLGLPRTATHWVKTGDEKIVNGMSVVFWSFLLWAFGSCRNATAGTLNVIGQLGGDGTARHCIKGRLGDVDIGYTQVQNLLLYTQFSKKVIIHLTRVCVTDRV